MNLETMLVTPDILSHFDRIADTPFKRYVVMLLLTRMLPDDVKPVVRQQVEYWLTVTGEQGPSAVEQENQDTTFSNPEPSREEQVEALKAVWEEFAREFSRAVGENVELHLAWYMQFLALLVADLEVSAAAFQVMLEFPSHRSNPYQAQAKANELARQVRQQRNAAK